MVASLDDDVVIVLDLSVYGAVESKEPVFDQGESILKRRSFTFVLRSDGFNKNFHFSVFSRILIFSGDVSQENSCCGIFGKID